jgi:xylan 1,4-beta-xylosidase
MQIRLANAPSPIHATIRRIDSDHANAKRRWQEIGSPEYLDAGAVAELNVVSRCEPEPYPFDFLDNAIGFHVILPPLSVAAVTLWYATFDRG